MDDKEFESFPVKPTSSCQVGPSIFRPALTNQTDNAMEHFNSMSTEPRSMTVL